MKGLRSGKERAVLAFSAALFLGLGVSACSGERNEEFPQTEALQGDAASDVSGGDAFPDDFVSIGERRQAEYEGREVPQEEAGVSRPDDWVDPRQGGGAPGQGDVEVEPGEGGLGQVDEYADRWVAENPERAEAIRETGHACSIQDRPGWSVERVELFLGHVAGDATLDTYPDVSRPTFDLATGDRGTLTVYYGVTEEVCTKVRLVLQGDPEPEEILAAINRGDFDVDRYLQDARRQEIFDGMESGQP
jgi:nucleotide-binding universal stress UspA family protein